LSSRDRFEPVVLVTGGAGFVGSAFAAAAHAAGYRVVVFDALTYAGDRRRLLDRGVPHTLVVGDVADRAAVAKAVAEHAPDILVHFAAESHVTRAAANPELTERTNVTGTRVVLEVARAAVRIPHVTYVSTAEVYGERRLHHASETDDADTAVVGAYAASKRAADRIGRTFAQDLPVAIVRPTIAFGPYQHPEKALPRWICSALDGEALAVWGDGSPVRQWIAVDDLADAVLRVAHSRSTGIFNVGVQHEPEVTNADLARRILREVGAAPTLMMFMPAAARPGDHRYSVTTERIESLGWKAGDFGSQLSAAVEWYRAHRTWWAPLRDSAESLYRRP
jgi:dTDP-glucose 4,6-dehydratase